MTQYPVILAGMNPTASLLQSLAPFFAYKAGDQSVTSSVALVNDTALVLPVVANATYFWMAFLNYEGGATSSSDIKYQWTLPAGATARFQAYNTAVGGTFSSISSTGTRSQATVYSMFTSGAATLCGATMWGTAAISSTAGNLQLQWAQNTSSATATIMHASSCLAMLRIS